MAKQSAAQQTAAKPVKVEIAPAKGEASDLDGWLTETAGQIAGPRRDATPFKRALRDLLVELGKRPDTEAFSDSVSETLREAVADIDAVLTAQVNEVIHHEEFRALEGTWRGL